MNAAFDHPEYVAQGFIQYIFAEAGKEPLVSRHDPRLLRPSCARI